VEQKPKPNERKEYGSKSSSVFVVRVKRTLQGSGMKEAQRELIHI